MAEQMSRRPPRLDKSAIATLESYAWPGNIRELRNIVHRAVLLCHGDVITESHLPLDRMGRTLSAATPDRPLPAVVANAQLKQRSRALPTVPPPLPSAASKANLKDDVEQ